MPGAAATSRPASPSPAAGQAHLRAGLGGHQRGRRPVPDVQSVLVVRVEPALGDHAQIQCGRTDPADIADQRQYPGQQRRLRGAPPRGVAEAGADQRHGEFVGGGAPQRLVARRRAARGRRGPDAAEYTSPDTTSATAPATDTPSIWAATDTE